MASIPNSVAKEHPFQRAGLGVAPFRCVGVERRVGPIKYVDPRFPGVTCEIGAAGQPMGTCQYCGQGIADCYVIVSSDKKRFIVGSDCVARTYQECAETLPTGVERAIAMVAREKNRARTEAKKVKLYSRFRAAKATLAVLPPAILTDKLHPYGYTNRKTGTPLTMRDYLDYIAANCRTDATAKFFAETVEAAAVAAGVELRPDPTPAESAEPTVKPVRRCLECLADLPNVAGDDRQFCSSQCAADYQAASIER